MDSSNLKLPFGTDHASRQQNLRTVLSHEQTLRDDPNFVIETYDILEGKDQPCFKKDSYFHSLRCGHIVDTEVPTPCGENCEEAEEEINPPFICIICKRWKMVLLERVPWRTSRFTELILPDFPDVDESYLSEEVRSRNALPVYLHTNHCFITPRSLEDIARLRYRADLDLERVVDEFCEIGRLSPAVCDEFRRLMNLLLDNQHRWITASFEELALITFDIVAVQPGICTNEMRQGLFESYLMDPEAEG
ncbi:hypothetical protein NX059_001808 [Plenodomus lindquistii]|nr:hypothetical protein NX059_001808 [Plenodomus lindquistii]